LHDTIEDTQTTFEELELVFGGRVAAIVRQVTDDKKLSKVERKKLQVEHFGSASLQALLVKLADKISNLSGLLSDPPIGWSRDIIRGYVANDGLPSVSQRLNTPSYRYAVWSLACLDAMQMVAHIELQSKLRAIAITIIGDEGIQPGDLESYYALIA
jgi:hypothetical protein